MKIQTKTTILFTVLTATIFLILNITVYFFVKSFSNNDFEKRLELRTKISAKLHFEQGQLSTEAFKEMQRLYLEKLPDENSQIFKIDIKGVNKVVSPVKELPVDFFKQIIIDSSKTTYYENSFRNYAGIFYRHQTGTYVVVASATNKYGRKMMQYLLFIKIASLLISTVLIFSVGMYFSKKTFQPIRSVINSVKGITEGNLHIRLKELDSSDEIAELTSTFNQMLVRLETAFEMQNNFISNASHELRTPLTAIVGEADLALSKERSTGHYQQSLQQISAHAEKLQHLTKGLLSLAQTGFDGKKQLWQTIRIDELLVDVKNNCSSIAPDANIKIKFDNLPEEEAAISINGNSDLLKVAISNVVLNGSKYADNKEVLITLKIQSQYVVIVVDDKGIGIPAQELKNIYDPFFRASNTEKYDGFGIGLPLTNNIIQLHKGTIEVASVVNVGTSVTIKLPVLK